MMGHTQDGKIFFGRNKKADHQLSESFYFIKIPYLEWMFSVKKMSFPAKTAM